jgi:hypothetical protein
MLINSMLSTLPLWFKGITKEIKKTSSYRSELEQYIIANNPQTTYDVERLTREYDRKLVSKVWW